MFALTNGHKTSEQYYYVARKWIQWLAKHVSQEWKTEIESETFISSSGLKDLKEDFYRSPVLNQNLTDIFATIELAQSYDDSFKEWVTFQQKN